MGKQTHHNNTNSNGRVHVVLSVFYFSFIGFIGFIGLNNDK